MPVNTFRDLVAHELEQATRQWDRMNDLADASGILAEELDEFWDEVRKPAPARDPRRLLRELVQLAAMCQRAVRDLRLIQLVATPLLPPDLPLPEFDAWLDDAAAEFCDDHQRVHTSHAAHTWLRAALRDVYLCLDEGGRKQSILALLALAKLGALCELFAGSLNLNARIDATCCTGVQHQPCGTGLQHQPCGTGLQPVNVTEHPST